MGPPPCPVMTVATEEEHARDTVAADARAAAGGRWRRWLARAARCEAEAAARGRAAPALVLARLLHLHLPPRHPGAVDLSDGRVRLRGVREADETKPFAPPGLFVHGHLCARDRAELAELGSQVVVVELVVLAPAHLAHHEEVCAVGTLGVP